MFKIIFIVILSWSTICNAQGAPEMASRGAQWQLTLDVIKTKAQSLLLKNNELAAQAQEFNTQIEKLYKNIGNLQASNNELRNILVSRKGRTDQQIYLEDLNNQLKDKKAKLAARQEEFNEWKKRLSDVERKINLRKLKIAELQLLKDQRDVAVNLLKSQEEQEAQKQTAAAGELDVLHKQLEEAKSQEVILEQGIATFKKNQEQGSEAMKAMTESNKELAARLELLRSQKLAKDKVAISNTFASQESNERLNKLKQRKIVLEAQIHSAELKAQGLKAALLAVHEPWPAQKKKMVHDMVQADARNSQLREKITSLREDIDILRDKIGKMERRINFMKAKAR